jgi:hypothetical protein
MDFLALFVSLPTRQTAGRMRIWRALRALGCATLRDGVFLLPDAPEHERALARIAEEVRATQGVADIYRLGGRGEEQRAQIVALFDRGADYVALMGTMAAADAGAAKALRGIRRELAALVAIDYFPGEAQRQAHAALVALESAAGGEPVSTADEIRRLASADFQGRTWATRKNLWVDRMASAWLIRRFIDRKAKFLWLDNSEEMSEVGARFRFRRRRLHPCRRPRQLRSAGGQLRPGKRSGAGAHRCHRALPRCRRCAGGRGGGHRGRAGGTARVRPTTTSC